MNPTPAELAAWFAPYWSTMQAYQAGTLACYVCGRNVQTAGVQAVRELADGSIVALCSSMSCLDDFHKAH